MAPGARIACIGGGPAGLYFAISMKLRDPSHEVVVIERNRSDECDAPHQPVREPQRQPVEPLAGRQIANAEECHCCVNAKAVIASISPNASGARESLPVRSPS